MAEATRHSESFFNQKPAALESLHRFVSKAQSDSQVWAWLNSFELGLALARGSD